MSEIERLRRENTEQRELIAELRREVAELKARLRQDSRNSHWPSSRDKGHKRNRNSSQRKKSKRKPGGQKGHPGSTLEFNPEPEHVEVHRPTHCAHCQHDFATDQLAEHVTRRQVVDLPPFAFETTEHQAETLVCLHCLETTQGRFPADVNAPVQYGKRVKSLSVYLKNWHCIPYARSCQLLLDVFGLHISPGSLENYTRDAARNLATTYMQIKQALLNSNVVHFDETGFYIGGQRQWCHSAGTPTLTLFAAHAKRGTIAMNQVGILPTFTGIAVHDFLAAYRTYKDARHALCNAHHLRDLTAIEEQGQQQWATSFKTFLLAAKRCVAQAQQVGLHQFPADQIARIEYLYHTLVDWALQANPPPADGWPQGKRGRPKKTTARNLAERFDKHMDKVLAFVYDFDVPFDNNLAERDLRMLKVQQKVSGCFRSSHGADEFCVIRYD